MIYAKLLKFREDQLENYQGPPIEYSVSDYHHAPRRAPRRLSTLASLQGQDLGRRHVSQYSILEEENPTKAPGNQRKPSVANTEQSYDPYRPSRNQISKTEADQVRITVLRRLSGSHKQSVSTTSLNRRTVSRGSARNPVLSRVQEGEAYSIASSPPPMGASIHQLNSSINEGRMSRCSSRRSMSSTVPVRTSMSYKRGVSFVHTRRRSVAANQLRVRKKRRATRTVQDQYVQDGLEQGSVSHRSLPRADSPQNVPPTIRSRKNTARSGEEIPARKSKTASVYWKEDARKLSSELEKVCDEAFNRASVASTVATTAPTENLDLSYESPATSLGIPDSQTSLNTYRAARRMDIKDSYLNRPLPLPPSLDHLGSFTYRELAKTRALLKERAADPSMVMGPGYFDEVIAHLDRLMQPSTTRVNEQDRRVVSTPDQPTRQPSKDEFEMLLARGPFSLRSVSDPVSKRQRKDLSGRKTVRVVSEKDQKPISPTKPLTIRKKSGSSTIETASDQQQKFRESYTVNARPYDRSQGVERRSAGLSLLESSLEPIEEDEDKENRGSRNSKTLFGEGKKRGWFRRHEPAQRSQDSNKGPPLPAKEDPPAQHHQSLGTRDKSRKRVSDVPSDESKSRVSEGKKASIGRGFFKIFSKRESKDSKNSADRVSGGRSMRVCMCLKRWLT